MNRKTVPSVSPYRNFTRAEWSRLREDTPLTLSPEELDRLKGLNEPISMDEVIDIYLPMSRLINLHYAASQQLFRATNEFLGLEKRKVPYIIGMAGSVSVGKSTTARILRTLLSRWADHPKVDLVPTDGFLLPNEEMERRGIMNRKGFPESYDLHAMLAFMADVKAGKRDVSAPTYSHLVYNVQPDKRLVVDRPDILIVEGLNVLQTSPAGAEPMPYVSLPAAARNRVPRPGLIFPSLCGADRERGEGNRHVDLGDHQPGQSAPEYPADPPARRPDPAQGQ